ncbi:MULTISPECIES: type II toxin-antitoxin system VapC family toxin [unclassified Thiocapsa]|uniref:type II toxin-antitoxin system VapC family toxin n=1 Tax=unclassified Thiocapsa TaxID=2641286 RepID=UPI0035B0A6C8
MYLLDTNLVSELRKARTGRADPGVVAWAASVGGEDQHLSVITVLELELGVQLRERRDPSQGEILRAWLERQVLVGLAGRILPIDTDIARRCAGLHVPNRRPDRDALIAATALVHGLTVVTRNVRDFDGTGVALHNPWSDR